MQGAGRTIYYHFSEIYCVFIYYSLTNHTSTVIWRTVAGVGKGFILTLSWNHQECLSCGADTSWSELWFWIRSQTHLLWLWWKSNSSQIITVVYLDYVWNNSTTVKGALLILEIKKKDKRKKCYLVFSIFFLFDVLFMIGKLSNQ